MLTRLIEISLRNRVLVILLFAIACAAGIYRMTQLPIDAFPDTTPIQVQVNTVAPALSPEEIEQQITLPVELSIGGLPGLQNVRSVSKFGFSQVVATFDNNVRIAMHANGLVTELSSTGGLLGIDPKAEFVDTNLDLDEGDVLVLISDGISEAMDERGRLLGRSRIADSLRSTPCVSAKSAAASVLDTARHHLDGRPASDDMTVIALEVSTTTRAQEVNG